MPEASRRFSREQLIAELPAVFLSLLQPVLFYWRVLVTTTAHIPYDLEAYHYPVLAWMAKCLRNGWLPLWDPYTYAGMPLHADPQAQMFYPPAWLAILAGNLSAGRHLFLWVEWLVAVHMMMAGLFAYLLARRMGIGRASAYLAATVYQLGGFFASQACHLGAVCCGAWLPLALLTVYESRRGFHRRWFALMAASVAMSLLAGYAATTIVVVGAMILFTAALTLTREARRSLWGVLFASFALALAICAVQVLPLIRLTGWSIASLRSDWLSAWGAPPQALVSLAWPDWYGIFDLSKYRLHLNFTLLYVYCGLIPLALVLISPTERRARPLLGLTVLCAFWMLGEHTPLYGLVFALLPGLIRGASYAWYAMMAFTLFLGLTAAMLLDRLGRRMPGALVWAMALVTAADLLHAGSNRSMNTAAGSYLESSSGDSYRGSAEDFRRLHRLVDVATPPLRIDYADLWSPGIAMAGMAGLPTIDGNIPFMLRRMYELRSLYCATTPNARDLAIAGADSPIFRRNLPVNRFESPLLRMTNTGFIASSGGLKTRSDSIGGLDLMRVENPQPRFWLADSVVGSRGEAETFRLLANLDLDPASAVVEGVGAGTVRLSGGHAEVRSYTPDRVVLRVQSNGAGFLATSEALYPGWVATVNGNPAQLLMTNGAFRGLRVPSGTSEIAMSYAPRELTASGLVSLLSILLAVFLARSTRLRAR